MIWLIATIGGIIGSAGIAPLIHVAQGETLREWWNS